MPTIAPVALMSGLVFCSPYGRRPTAGCLAVRSRSLPSKVTWLSWWSVRCERYRQWMRWSTWKSRVSGHSTFWQGVPDKENGTWKKYFDHPEKCQILIEVPKHVLEGQWTYLLTLGSFIDTLQAKIRQSLRGKFFIYCSMNCVGQFLLWWLVWAKIQNGTPSKGKLNDSKNWKLL